MAESYISELGDKLSHGVANTDGSRVKIIAPKLYTDGNSHPSIATALAGKAPTSHASSATTYGVGTTANYGHVKLATGDMNGATHADGVAVSKNHTHSQYLPLATGGRVNGPVYGYFPSTRNTMVGHEYNCFINAKERGVLSFEQSGTGQLSTDQVWALFDGKLEPQYSSTGIDASDPYVLTLSLNKYGSTHTQAFVAFGWTCRYWWPVRYKVEAYNTYQSANTWVVLCDYSNVDTPAVNLFIPFGSDTTNPHTGNKNGGCFTKFRITIYKGDSTTTPANRWGISEIFYCFPEAYKLHSGLSVYSSETALGISRSLASSGTISATNIVNVIGSSDGFKMDYSSTSADAGKMTIYTTDDSNASISIGNNVSGTYKEAVSIVNGSATITGSLTGPATKLGSANLGSTTKPIYLVGGVATECSNYAGGTAVTLNGTSASASTASFYAPTGAGTSGQILKSSGSGAPTWATANAALVGITVTSTSVSDGTNTFNKYTHPTSSGNKHVPSGGSSGQFLGWSADGTAAWVANPNTDTKVTSSANHYTPATASGSDKTASASGATAAWSIDVVKGVTLNTDGKGHVTGLSVTSGKIPGNPNTDTKVTSAANHYTPETASGSDKTASASGATAAWSIDVVKGVTLNTDGKGHVTGLSVTSGKIPGNPNTDTKVTQTNTDTSSNAQYRLLMSATADDTTRTEGARKSTYAWFNPSTQTLGSQKFNVAGGCTMQYNSTTMSLDFVF